MICLVGAFQFNIFFLSKETMEYQEKSTARQNMHICKSGYFKNFI